MQKFKTNNILGFTLLEILAVTVIIGGLALLALPNFDVASQKVKNQEAIQTLLVLYEAQIEHFKENGVYAEEEGVSDINTALNTNISDLSNFTSIEIDDTPTLSGGPVDVAQVEDVAGDFRLYALDNGEIVCKATDASTGEIGVICRKMGYSEFGETSTTTSGPATSSPPCGSLPPNVR